MKEYDWMGSFLFKGVQINGEEYDNTTSSGITISLCTIVKLNVHVSNQSGKSVFRFCVTFSTYSQVGDHLCESECLALRTRRNLSTGSRTRALSV